MIGEMMTLLEAEQVGDDKQEGVLHQEFRRERENEAEAPARQIAGYKNAIEDRIPELDGSVKKATEIRQKQRAEYMTGCSQC